MPDEPLRPEQARWIESRDAHLALLRYDDARAAVDPRATVLDFYESAYRAGDALGAPAAYVARGEESRNAGLRRERAAVQWPVRRPTTRLQQVGPVRT